MKMLAEDNPGAARAGLAIREFCRRCELKEGQFH
jgi:hypothetical protein